MTTRCEWCAHETAVARKCNGRVQCAMMAGYTEAQLHERLAYLCKDAATQNSLQARIVACALNQGSSNAPWCTNVANTAGRSAVAESVGAMGYANMAAKRSIAGIAGAAVSASMAA